MNKLIILPGNSVKNKAWGEAVAARFGGWFDEVYLQSYDHWESGEENIDFEVELAKLGAAAKAAAPETTFYIFAKSAGSLLALLAIQRGLVAPAQCVFFGMPLEWADRDVFRGDWSPLSDFRVPILAFHNEHDPVANYTFTKDALTAHVPESTQLVTAAGDN